MAFHHGKFLLVNNRKPNDETKYASCYTCYDCPDECNEDYFPPQPPPLSPPQPPPPPLRSPKLLISATLIIIICVLGAIFMIISYLSIRRYRSRLRNSGPLENSAREDFIDENRGPVVDHPIWNIRRVGLQQSIIDSITIFKYKSGERLIEGTDCSVCLSGFQENESLRLLPKCSHAFHVPCIDTWLRSNKHCPLCRAPIVSNTNAADQVSAVVDTNSSNLGSGEEELTDRRLDERDVGPNLTGETRIGAENIGVIPVEDRKLVEMLQKNCVSLNARTGKFRVLSDLADHRATVDKALHSTVRRSISMDFSSTSIICNGVADIRVKKEERNPDAISSIYRLIKSRSYGCSIQKVSISMKRSFSFNPKQLDPNS